MVLMSLVLAALPKGVHSRLGDTGSDGGRPPLCAPVLVQETCELLVGEQALVTQEALRDLAAVEEEEDVVRRLWLDIGLPVNGTSCGNLCLSIVEYLRARSWQLPPASDTGCYASGKGSEREVRCDLDLAPQRLNDLVPADEDFPNLNRSDIFPLDGDGNESDHGASSVSNTPVENPERAGDRVAARVANLFRIYPMLDMNIELASAPGAHSQDHKPPENWEAGVAQRNQQAQAWVSLAIRGFQAHQTPEHVKAWFGEHAVEDLHSRKKILGVIQSISNVLSMSTYVYPGKKCKPGDFAYVFSCMPSHGGHPPRREKDPNGKFIINLCETYMKVGMSEQLVTLAHEASHHRWACTEDFMYRARPCKKLARSKPARAMRNAENYGYFIRDVARNSTR